MEEKNKNVNIILFLSTYNEGAKDIEYKVENDEEIKFIGTQTYQAPIQYLLQQAKNENKNVRRIICITSHEVKTKKYAVKTDQNDDCKEVSQFELFMEYVNQHVTENENEIEFVEIPYDYYLDGNGEAQKTSDPQAFSKAVYNKMLESFGEKMENEEIYIEYTGGFRDISFLMTSIIRFLEFKGLECGKIVYSNYSTKKICDIHYIYDIYQIINGVNEFVNTGNAKELSKMKQFSSEGNTTANNLINNIIEFSNALSICNIGLLDKITKVLIDNIKELESSKENDIYILMLKSLVPTIKEKMYLEEEINYPKMIKWCAENNMIQQAATIYTDKMPQYYYRKENIFPEYVVVNEEETKYGQTSITNAFYSTLYDRAAEGLEMEDFFELLISANNELKRNNKSINKSEVINLLKNMKEISKNNIIQNAFGKLIEYVERYNDDELKWKTDQCIGICSEITYEITDDNKIINDNKSIWNIVLGTKKTGVQVRHKLLYNNIETYNDLVNIKNIGTYNKKIKGIREIEDGKIALGEKCDKEKLCKVMKYYLAVKLMRNRMNHASEGERSNDESEAISGLDSMGIRFADDINTYKEIIITGVNLFIDSKEEVTKCL